MLPCPHYMKQKTQSGNYKMVAAKSAWNYACPLQKQQQQQKKPNKQTM